MRWHVKYGAWTKEEGRAGSIPVQKAEYAGFSEFHIKQIFGVRWSSLSMILKKFLKFGKSSLDDSYKKDSYKEKVCKRPPAYYFFDFFQSPHPILIPTNRLFSAGQRVVVFVAVAVPCHANVADKSNNTI